MTAMTASALPNVTVQPDDKLLDCQLKLLDKLRSAELTSLSSYVKDILDIPIIACTSYSYVPPSANANLKASINILEGNISLKQHSTAQTNYYKATVSQITPMLTEVHSAMRHLCPAEYVEDQIEILTWLCLEPKELVRCLQDAQSGQQGVQYCACLQLTSILERSLQDLHWSKHGTTPIVLKDLLGSQTLSQILGENMMIFLDVLVGQPKSLNIRNLVWHGFGSVGENPERYSLIIFFTFIAIGKILKTNGVIVSHRPFLKADASLLNTRHVALFANSSHAEFTALMATIDVKSCELRQAMLYASHGEYGLATILLLSSFEQLMRVSFCVYNHCPDRILTAESSEYFTTLDHVFEEYLSDKVTVNALHSLIPDRLRTALCDLLYYPQGLRLRDRLSHMELSYLDITEQIWCYTFNVISTTIMHTIFNNHSTDAYNYLVHEYIPVYHPLSIVLDSLEQLSEHISLVNDIAAPEGMNSEVHGNADDGAVREKLLQYFQYRGGPSELSVSKLMFPGEVHTRRKLSLSSEYKPVAEWCKLILSICNNLLNATKVIEGFHDSRQTMLKAKTLRSRQRKNYAAFLRIKCCLVRSLESLCSVAKALTRMMTVITCDCAVQRPHKMLLQLVENLYALVEQNKWSHSVDYLNKFVTSNFS